MSDITLDLKDYSDKDLLDMLSEGKSEDLTDNDIIIWKCNSFLVLSGPCQRAPS